MKKSIHFRVYGVVQGVFFRKHTQNTTLSLKITGWVRNCEDGAVEGEAEGAEDALKEFIQWCHKGPAKATVTKVETTEVSLKNFTSFEIRR